ncbi:MAG: hypothetical protein GWN32_00190, partial [Gemmatimonadetes bacterium]|nr:hypothetical protein [Gemmatimonadota bacterium]
SGFGRMEGYQGPYGDRPAFDIVAEAMSGIMHLVGFEDRPPSWTIYGMADIYSGMVTAYGIMQARRSSCANARARGRWWTPPCTTTCSRSTRR